MKQQEHTIVAQYLAPPTPSHCRRRLRPMMKDNELSSDEDLMRYEWAMWTLNEIVQAGRNQHKTKSEGISFLMKKLRIVPVHR